MPKIKERESSLVGQFTAAIYNEIFVLLQTEVRRVCVPTRKQKKPQQKPPRFVLRPPRLQRSPARAGSPPAQRKIHKILPKRDGFVRRSSVFPTSSGYQSLASLRNDEHSFLSLSSWQQELGGRVLLQTSVLQSRRLSSPPGSAPCVLLPG